MGNWFGRWQQPPFFSTREWGFSESHAFLFSFGRSFHIFFRVISVWPLLQAFYRLLFLESCSSRGPISGDGPAACLSTSFFSVGGGGAPLKSTHFSSLLLWFFFSYVLPCGSSFGIGSTRRKECCFLILSLPDGQFRQARKRTSCVSVKLSTGRSGSGQAVKYRGQRERQAVARAGQGGRIM